MGRARARRRLWAEEAVSRARAVRARQVRRARHAECTAQTLRLGKQRKTAFVWHIEPLVRVCGNRLSAFHAPDQMSRPRGDRSEHTERTVKVEPGAVAFGDVGQVGDRVEVTGVDLTGVADDDRRLT